jgi:DNA-binding transcriptional LysR family regulator
MKLSHLRRFVAVAERGSMRSAARELGLPQPVITRSIQEMERELGVQLFERTITGIVMTPVAENILRRARVVETELRRTIEEVEQFKGQDRGTLTVGLSSATHVAILPRVFAPFRKRFPNVRLKIVEGLFPSLEGDICDGIIEIYVGPVPLDRRTSGLIVEPLFENRRVIIGRRGHPLAHATSIHELKDAEWVTTPTMMDSENEVNAIYTAAGLPPPSIVAQAVSGLTVLSIVSSSDVLGPLPQLWLEFIMATELVVPIPIVQQTYAPTISIARQSRIHLTPAAQYFNDLVQRAAENHVRAAAPPKA